MLIKISDSVFGVGMAMHSLFPIQVLQLICARQQDEHMNVLRIFFILVFSEVLLQLVSVCKSLQLPSCWDPMTFWLEVIYNTAFLIVSVQSALAWSHLYPLQMQSLPIRVFIDLKIISAWFRKAFLSKTGTKAYVFTETEVNTGRNISLNSSSWDTFHLAYCSGMLLFLFFCCFFFIGWHYLRSWFSLPALDPADKV